MRARPDVVHLVTRVHLMMLVATLPLSLSGQEPIPVRRPIGLLDPYDPVRFPSLLPVRAHFEWSLKERFGFDRTTIASVSSLDSPDGLIDYDYSRCYLHPESGPPCPTHPWLVTFDATGTSGTNPSFTFDWVIPGDAQCNSVIAGRIDHTTTLLSDGKVLIAGGRAADGTALTGVEIYDPATGSFSPTGSLLVGRMDHTATLLPNGKVLIAGGASLGPTAELYDPATRAFSPTTGSMSSRRENHTATLLPNGRVLIAGGRLTQRLSTGEIYDPSTGTFSATGSMTAARDGHTATLLVAGQVLIVGGAGGFGTSAELYNPTTNAFGPTSGSMSNSYFFHTATLLQDGRVLIAVGSPASATYLAAAELYDPATSTFSRTTSRMTGRIGHTATRLPSGKVLITGGLSGPTTLATAEVFDPATSTFSATVGTMDIERKYHTATLLPTGRVLIAGGASRTYLSSAASYDPATSTFGPAEILGSIALSVPDAAPFVDSPVISCAFATQGTYAVTLKAKEAVGPVASITRDVTVKDLLIVSIGNSLASGQGNPDRPRIAVACYSESDCAAKLRERGASQWQLAGKMCVSQAHVCIAPAQWQDERCNRSFRSGPALAAWSIERLDPHTSVTFLHLACSGAGVKGSAPGLLEPYRGQNPTEFFCPTDPVAKVCQQRIGLASNPPVLNECPFPPAGGPLHRACYELLPPQVDQVARYLCSDPLGSDASGRTTTACLSGRARGIDALLISVGINDLGFSRIVKACAVFLNCHLRFSQSGNPSQLNDLIRPVEQLGDRLAELPNKYHELRQAIHEKLDAPKVFITQYPDPTGDAEGNYCNPALPNFREYAHRVEIKGWINEALYSITEALAATVDFEGLTSGELAWATENMLKPLDLHIRQSAASNGWTYVHGLSDALQGVVWPPGPEDFFYHGVCAGSQKWIVGLQASYETQGDLNGTLHPNFLGQTAYQTRIVEALIAAEANLSSVRQFFRVIGPRALLNHPTIGFRGLNVRRANVPPVANAGVERTVRLGSLITLDGTRSADADARGRALDFSWAQTEGPTGVLTAGRTATPTITFAPTVEGHYVFSLVVNDGEASSAPTSVTIRVPLLGDIDTDGDVDSSDVRLLRAAGTRPANGQNDLLDLDGDRTIGGEDVRIVGTLCTRPGCATITTAPQGRIRKNPSD